MAAIGLASAAVVRSRAHESGAGAAVPSSGASPSHVLFDKEAVLACPQLEASGTEEPQGWLGAAAADIVCRRALWMLGGRPERIVWPAQLLDLPTVPSEDFPSDPFGAPGARDRALEAAKRRATVYLDGTIALEKAGFATRITLHRASGEEVATANGRGKYLDQAVRAAVAELETAHVLPHQREVDPEIGQWLPSHRVDAMLATDDMSFGWTTYGDACLVLSSMRDDLAGRGDYVSSLCPGLDARSGSTAQAVDDRWPGAFLATAFATSGRADTAAVRAKLDALERSGTSAVGTSSISSLRGVLLLKDGDVLGAMAANLKAIAATPFDFEVWNYAMGAAESGALSSNAVGFSAWNPAAGEAWAWRGRTTREDAGIVWARRARAAASILNDWWYDLAGRHVAAGKVEQLRALAATFADDLPGHHAIRQVLLSRMRGMEGKLGDSFERARECIDTAELNPMRDEVHLAVQQASQLGQILRKPADWADPAAKRLVIAISDARYLQGGRATLAALICLYASKPVARECAEHLERATSGAAVDWTYGGRDLFAGVKRYLAGDLRGAVAAWRPMLAGQGILMLRYVPTEIFDAAGEPELAERIDNELADRAFFHGISAALPRMAQRALARGDKARARELAQRVVDAWSVADVPVPAVDDMRKLLLRAQ